MSGAVVFHYRYPAKYAFNVLAGAVETHVPNISLDFPRNVQALAATVEARRNEGRRVLVAWSFYSPGFDHAREELAAFRALTKDVPCVAGGVHASAEPRQVLAAGFDLIAVGEGERTIVDLASRLDRGEPLPTGILPRGQPITLDDFPPFAPRHRRYGAIEITRGCIYACGFCQTPFMNRAKFRHRSVENICFWVEDACRAGLEDVRFITPTSMSYGASDQSVQLEAVEELLARVRVILGPERSLFYGTFPSEVRPEHVTDAALAILKKYVDNDNLIIGGQSGSQRILDATHRGHGVEEISVAARRALAHGFVPNVDFIFGLPGETVDDAQKTFRLMAELADLGARVHAHTFMPLPGTPLKDASPGKVDPSIEQALDRMASRGRLYGQWRAQARLAARLATGAPGPTSS